MCHAIKLTPHSIVVNRPPSIVVEHPSLVSVKSYFQVKYPKTNFTVRSWLVEYWYWIRETQELEEISLF